MGYIMLLLATLAWSFVGILVKLASEMVDTSIITFMRFAVGVVFLGAFLLLKDGRIKLRGNLAWVWIGALGKSLNYYFENVALTKGYAYGNILIIPIQTVTLLLISAILLKDRVSGKGWIAAVLCILGVMTISLNGQSLSLFLDSSAEVTVLFTVSALGSALHVLSTKKLLKDLDTGNMNLSIFAWCSLLMAIPLPVQSTGFIGPVTGLAWAALVLLGLITGLSFYWFSEAIRRLSFPLVVIVSNSTGLFSILWSFLFFHEPITRYVVSGTFAFLVGLFVLNLPSRAKARV